MMTMPMRIWTRQSSLGRSWTSVARPISSWPDTMMPRSQALPSDAVNRTLISVGSDSKLILWSFKTQAAHRKSPIYLPSPATMLRHVRDSDLAAIVLEDYSVLIFDCDLQNIVRRLGIQSFPSGPRHSAPITDVAFSPSGRRLLTASLDSTIRVWDVPNSDMRRLDALFQPAHVSYS